MRYYSIFFLFILSSCDERIKFDYEDAKSNKIEYFFENDSVLTFHHDLDNSVIEGYFISKDIGKYSSFVDSVSSLHQWNSIVNDKDKKMFIRKDSGNYSISAITFWGNEVHIKIYSF